MSWLARCTEEFTPIVNNGVDKSKYVHLDLSLLNKELTDVDLSNPQAIQAYINSIYLQKNASTAFGGYLERRGIYRRSNYFRNSDSETERNIHLGIDIWREEATQVIAPLDGRIHSFQNNTHFGDYGPTIILEHSFENKTFYTLYGHLSLESILKLKVGQLIEKGTSFCKLGDESVNGNYAPHLHFQVILDLNGKTGDYPGVCSAKDLVFYKSNCPDPNLILKIV